RAAGAGLDRVVATTVYVATADRADLVAAWDVVRRHFGDHDAPSTLVGVAVPMRWSDMDAYGHVNNVIFLGYFEMARVDLFFERASLEERTGLRRGTVVAEHAIRYKRPVVYSAEPLQVQIWVSDVRAAAFSCHYEVFD